MNGRITRLVSLMCGLLAGLAVGVASAADAPVDSAWADTGARLALLPLANHTGSTEAAQVVVPGLHRRLGETGVEFLTAADLRPLLREHRIRSVGQVGADAATLIRDRTGVDYLLLGSLDIYDVVGREVAVSLRILDIGNLELIKAVSVAVAGEDFTGFFDVGRMDSIAVVADHVLDRALTALGEPLLPASPRPAPSGPRLAVVPLDNMSETPQASAVVANILLSNLLAEDYDIVEPGFVTEVFLARQTMARGQIDLPTLQAIHATHGPDFVLVGVVDLLQPARGDLTATVPSLAFGTRLLEADTGRLLAAWEIGRDGGDGEWLLGLGRTHSLGQLTAAATRELIDRLDRELEHHRREGSGTGD